MKVSFNFSDVVIVEGDQVGVVVKSWAEDTHDVYVRTMNRIKEYRAVDMRHYPFDKEIGEYR